MKYVFIWSMWKTVIFRFSFHVLCSIHVCVCLCVFVHLSNWTYIDVSVKIRGQLFRIVSVSTMWVLETKLKLLGLSAAAYSHQIVTTFLNTLLNQTTYFFKRRLTANIRGQLGREGEKYCQKTTLLNSWRIDKNRKYRNYLYDFPHISP